MKQALDYITVPEKTCGGRLVGSLNCQQEQVYEQMRQTKEQFGKTDQRQGYHLIISFVEGEVDADTAFEVIGKFAKEYLGRDYEALYAVHDNTEHVHGHIIFNSVSFRDGRKYRYKKGDWAREIQPITNRLCEEYGLSTIEISEDRAKKSENYKEWNDFRDGKFVWADMIKRDIDAAVLQSATYESFLSVLSDMGYGIKNAYRTEGKYLAIKPMGMSRFRRCRSLGENYTEERIWERIAQESLSSYKKIQAAQETRIVRCRVRRYKRAKMSGIQKRYFARLYAVREEPGMAAEPREAEKEKKPEAKAESSAPGMPESALYPGIEYHAAVVDRDGNIIEDGEKIKIRYPDGEEQERVCRFIDECHMEVGNNLYHICQFAEIMERNGSEYLKQYRKVTYTNLLTSGKLNAYLADINEQAQERSHRLIEDMKQAQGITEQLKAENALEWTGKMNNILACAREIVNKELIYT